MNNLVLIIAHAKTNDSKQADHSKRLRASVLGLDAGAFSALTTKVWCGGNGGCAGFDDSPVRRVCPGYGQMN
ncbi:MAG TPA: hypothetical protein VMU11_02830 [Verrucomicrobiae bacterium]|nr:hypothetical protein [Verrucomicrobiae bacterium]